MKRPPLSEAAQRARLPLPPEVLAAEWMPEVEESYGPSMVALSSLAAREAQRVIQPPQEGRGDVWGDILAHLAAKGTGPLLDACRARNDFGIAKYGRPLRYGDGRGAADQLQEALDLAAYAWRDGAVTRACRALELAEEILGEMER